MNECITGIPCDEPGCTIGRCLKMERKVNDNVAPHINGRPGCRNQGILALVLIGLGGALFLLI